MLCKAIIASPVPRSANSTDHIATYNREDARLNHHIYRKLPPSRTAVATLMAMVSASRSG